MNAKNLRSIRDLSAFDKLNRQITEKPWCTVVTLLICVVALTYGAIMLTGALAEVFDLDKEIPREEKWAQSCLRLREYFPEDDVVELVGIECIDGLTEEFLRTIYNVSEEAKSWPEVVSVASPATVTSTMVNNKIIDTVKAFKEWTRGNMSTPRLREIIMNDKLMKNLFSDDYLFAVVAISFDAKTNQQEAFVQIQGLIDKDGENPLVEKSCTPFPMGRMILNEHINITTNEQIAWFPIAVMLMAAILIVFVGFREALGTILVVVFSIICTYGISGYLGNKLSVLTACLPILLLAMGDAFGFKMCYWTRKNFDNQEEKNGKQAVTQTLKTVGLRILFAALTSTIGFLSLQTFRLKTVRDFGLWAAVGILFCLLFSTVWLSALLTIWYRKKEKKYQHDTETRTQRLARRIHSAAEWPLHMLAKLLVYLIEEPVGRFFLMCLICLTLLASILGITRLQTGSAPHLFFPPDHPIRKSVAKFQEKMGGNTYFMVMVRGEEADNEKGSVGIKSPILISKMERFQKKIEEIEEVANVTSVVDFLKIAHQVLEQKPYGYEGWIRSDQDTSGDFDNSDAVAQALLFLSMDAPLDEWADNNYENACMKVLADVNDSAVMSTLIDKIDVLAQEMGLNIEFGGEYVRWGKSLNYYIVTGKIINIFTCLVLCGLFTSLALRGFRLGVIAILPLIFTTVTVFGVMGHLGIRLDMTSCIIATFVVFLVVDWAFYLIGEIQDEFVQKMAVANAVTHALRLETTPIMIDAITNIASYLVLTRSGFEPIRTFGWLISLAQVVGSLSTLVIIPLIIYRFPTLISKNKRLLKRVAKRREEIAN